MKIALSEGGKQKDSGEVGGQLKLALIIGEVSLKQTGCSKESEL